jgi:hypothetical protein
MRYGRLDRGPPTRRAKTDIRIVRSTPAVLMAHSCTNTLEARESEQSIETIVTEHLGLRLQRERFQRFGVGVNAQVCTFNVRNLLAFGI